jgi:DNA invertase Pin-like site-specific DNA recombinase
VGTAVAEPVTRTIIAASYERVSTRVQGQTGFSLAAQHESNEAFAESRGWTLPENLRFRDGENANASGKDWDLPGLNGMLEAAQRREFRYLVVPDRDRFARDVLKAKILEDQLNKYGVHVVYQRAPTEEGPEGQLANNVFFALAEYEIAKTRRRTMTGRLDKARSGRVVGNGGKAPYGYRLTYETLSNGHVRVAGMEPDAITGTIAIRIIRMARTESTWEIAKALMGEGIPGPGGGRWSSKAVHRIVYDRTHIGQWSYAEGAIEVPVPPLIAEADGRTPTAAWLADWQAAQEGMRARQLHSGARVAKAEDEFQLRRMLVCGHCGQTLRSSSNGKSKNSRPIRYYVCPCHAPSRARKLDKPICELPDVPAIAIEEEAWRVICETLLNAGVLAAGLEAARSKRGAAERVRRDQRAVIDIEITKHRKTLDSLVDQLVKIESTALLEAVDRRAKELEGMIAALIRQRDNLIAGAGDGLTDAEATAIQEFAATARIGLAEATRQERRQLFETLRLRGQVLADPEGLLLGQRNRFRTEWEARIPLSHTAAGLLKRDSL